MLEIDKDSLHYKLSQFYSIKWKRKLININGVLDTKKKELDT